MSGCSPKRSELDAQQSQTRRGLSCAGDTDANAQRIAQATGITHVAAGLSPEQKLQAIRDARDKAGPSPRGPGVIMVKPLLPPAPRWLACLPERGLPAHSLAAMSWTACLQALGLVALHDKAVQAPSSDVWGSPAKHGLRPVEAASA